MQTIDSSTARPALLATPSAATLTWRLATVGLVYYAAARLGLLIPYVGSHVSLVWLPTGIAVAAYLRWGGAMAPAILLAAFAVNYEIGGPAWMCAAIASGNALGPWVSAVLLRRWAFDAALTSRRDLGVYLMAVIVGMLVTATNGTVWLRVAELLPPAAWTTAWLTWWIGDAVGALLGGVPLVAANRVNLTETFTARRGAINGALLGIVLLCGLLAFSPWTELPAAVLFPLLSLPLFVMAVLALRAGVLAASLAVLLLSACAAWGTARGVGPFAGHDTHAGLLALWSYITAQACTNVLICGLAAELLASRRQQAALFTHAADGILLVSPDGEFEQMNPAARRMLGIPAGAIGTPRVSDLPFGNGPTLAAWLAQGAAHRGTQYLRLTRPNGSTLEVEAQTVQHSDARGQLVSQLMLRDVTERREAEARLAASEERLRAITDSAPALIAELDEQARYCFANRTYRDWMGRDPQSLIGRPLAEVLGATAFAEIRPHIEAALRGEAAAYERQLGGGADGRHIHVSLVPRRDADGAVRGFYALGSDITARLRAEEALRQSELRLRSVADRLPMRVSYVDSEERYRFLNLAYERAFGRPRDTLYGRTVREVLGDGAYAETGPRIRRALAGETVSFESEITTQEGYRCYRASYVPQFGDDGKSVHGFVAIITDTTAQKLEERRLIELSQVDNLTGLLNRAGFEQRRHQALERSRATRNPLALMLLDIDGFKRVNDTRGHLAGDMLLRGFAERLNRILRAEDTIARPGGDEFAIVVEGLGQAHDAATIAQNIVNAMHAPFILEAERIEVTTSIGVALYHGEAGVSARDLTKRADDLLYAAKAGGRDRYCMD
ncbi:MAG TPA: PAS domain-containing protein [Burkholderiaceae bacterium]|nr:PAS domain-containing protein [Burkholderiaceae bacterium]